MGTTRRQTLSVCILLSVVLAASAATLQAAEGPVDPAGHPIDTRCPCLSASDCPRVYNASSSDDIRHFGQLSACKDSLHVRCCGAEVEVRETVSVGFRNGSMEIVDQSLTNVRNETGESPTNLEEANDQLNSTLEKVVVLKPEARILTQPEIDFNINDPVNIISTNESKSIKGLNETLSVHKANASANVPKDVNATAEEDRQEPDAASSVLDIQQITPANLSLDASMNIDLLPTNASINENSNSTEVIDTGLLSVTVTTETVQVFYPPAIDVIDIDNVAANSTIEDEMRQVLVSDSFETELAGENKTSILSASPLSAAGNNEDMARSLQADEFDNRSENASVAAGTVEIGVEQNGNSSQLYPGPAEQDQSNDTMSLDSDKNDTMSMREDTIEATMNRMNQMPGIMYVFPMHNMRKKKEQQTPFLVFPAKNSTDNETVEILAKSSKIEDVVSSDLDSMASTAEGVSSTVKGKVIIRKFMPKAKTGHSQRNKATIKTSAVTAAPTTPKESEKSVAAADDHPESTSASPTRAENNGTSPSIKFKPNLKYKINTARRLPSKFSIKTRTNGRIRADQENNSSLLTQGPVANRSLSQADMGIDINAPIRSKSIMIKRIALKSKAGASTPTLTGDAIRLEASGSEQREDILLPEGGAVANRRAIPSREDVAHPSRATSKGARPGPASRRRRPVAATTEDALVTATTPTAQTIRPRSSSFRRRPVLADELSSTTTAEPKKLGSYLVNIRIKPIFGEVDNNETTVAPVESSKTEEAVEVVTEAPLESLKLNENISSVVIPNETEAMVVSSTSMTSETVLTTKSLSEVQEEIGNVTVTDVTQSPNLETRHAVYGSMSETPELIVVDKQNSSLVEHLPPTKARVSYTRTTPAPTSEPVSKSGIKNSSRQQEKRKVVENKGNVTPKAPSFPGRGSVRFMRPIPKFGSDGYREVAQESQLVGVLESGKPVKETASKTVEHNTNKTVADDVKSMKIILPADHNSEIPIKIMLSNTEKDGVIEIMLPKMDPKIPMQIASQVRPTRSSNKGSNSPKGEKLGVIPFARNPGFFSIVGPIPKGFADPALINQRNSQSPVLDLPKQHNFKKFRDTHHKRFLKPVVDVESMKNQHFLFLSQQFNKQKKYNF